jgi:hypothetical protein
MAVLSSARTLNLMGRAPSAAELHPTICLLHQSLEFLWLFRAILILQLDVRDVKGFCLWWYARLGNSVPCCKLCMGPSRLTGAAPMRVLSDLRSTVCFNRVNRNLWVGCWQNKVSKRWRMIRTRYAARNTKTNLKCTRF